MEKFPWPSPQEKTQIKSLFDQGKLDSEEEIAEILKLVSPSRYTY